MSYNSVSPSLHLRPTHNMLASCQQSSSHTAYYAHNTSNTTSISAASHSSMATSAAAAHGSGLVLDASHSGSGVVAHGSGGSLARSASFALDVSDPNGNAMTLMRNVESVYFQSMTKEDEKNKIMREKMHAEDQVRRLCEDKDKLAAQLATEKSRRTTDVKLAEELASNAILMKDILNRQQEVKRAHDSDFRSVKELQRHSAMQRTIIDRLHSAVQVLKQKQTERKVIKEQRQQLWERASGLKQKLTTLETNAIRVERTLRAEAAAARDALAQQAEANEKEGAERLVRLRGELEARFKAELAASTCRAEAALDVMRSELALADCDAARAASKMIAEAAAASVTLASAQQQHEQQQADARAALDALELRAAELEASQAKEREEVAERCAEQTEELTKLQEELATRAAEADALRAEIDSSSSEMAEIRRSAEEAREENLRKALANLAELSSLKKASEEASAQLKAATRERDQQAERCGALEKAAEAAAAAHESEVGALSQSHAARVSALELAAEETREAMEEERRASHATVEALRERVRSLEGELSTALAKTEEEAGRAHAEVAKAEAEAAEAIRAAEEARARAEARAEAEAEAKAEAEAV